MARTLTKHLIRCVVRLEMVDFLGREVKVVYSMSFVYFAMREWRRDPSRASYVVVNVRHIG